MAETAPGSWVPTTNTLLGHLATAGLVAVLIVFMLLERQDLRNRVMSVFGHGHLARTTRALEEAADVLAPDVAYYQRLLAGDQSEAAELIEEHVAKHPGETVYDALLLPSLTYAERDRAEGRLSAEEERGIVEATRELIGDAETSRRARQPDTDPSPDAAVTQRVTLLGFAAHTDADRLALEMLANLLEGTPFLLQIASVHALSSDAVAMLAEGGYAAVCIADLPPSSPSKARYLVRRLRAAVPKTRRLSWADGRRSRWLTSNPTRYSERARPT